MQNQIQARIEQARRIMLDAPGNPVNLPEELCRQLMKDCDNHNKEFMHYLVQADMVVNTTRAHGVPIVVGLTYYPSFEYLGPRTAMIYVSPNPAPLTKEEASKLYVSHFLGKKQTESFFSSPFKRIINFFSQNRK